MAQPLDLAADGWTARLLPGQGAAFATLRHNGHEVLSPLPDGLDPNATPAGAFLMLPWTNRLDGGHLAWPHGSFDFPVNRVAENTAIHGLSRALPWQVTEVSAGAAVLGQAYDVAPYRYHARLEVALSAQGCRLTFSLRHEGRMPMPYGIGWHPWFHRPVGSALDFHATHRLLTDSRTLPVAVEPCPGMAGPVAPHIGLDGHHAGWDGRAVLRWPDGRAMVMTASGAIAKNLHVFLPGFSEAVCLEPVSHVPDVANRPSLAAYGAMAMLAPGETLEGGIELVIEG